MTTAVTDFSVKIETKAKKDEDIESAQKPEKVERPILPATGKAKQMNLLGFTLMLLGFILSYKDRSESR